MVDRDATLAKATASIEAAMPSLLALSREIHDYPELKFEEYAAHSAVTGMLDRHGFTVRNAIAGLDTAFDARHGNGALKVALCAEYDALPEIGHACGHNLIAASSVGAALGLAAVGEALDLTTVVLGTPAEEGGGGKVTMLEAGCFEGLHFAMMAHPWPVDRLTANCLAVDNLGVRFHGRGAHASAAPEQGLNAADAAVIAQVSLGLLRQQLPHGDQIHAIVTHGGDAVNVVPESTSMNLMCRSVSAKRLDALRLRAEACLQAGALASGCSVEIKDLAPRYSHMEADAGLLARYRGHMEARGRTFADDDAGIPAPMLSTDMANVSLALPSIHPMVGVDAQGSVNHQAAFAAACIGPSSEKAILDAAVALCATAIDAASEPDLRSRLMLNR
ncbi:MAG: M20 family metallopeptidase [Actinomycetota bacterium]